VTASDGRVERSGDIGAAGTDNARELPYLRETLHEFVHGQAWRALTRRR
jgi:hypothetical protein